MSVQNTTQVSDLPTVVGGLPTLTASAAARTTVALGVDTSTLEATASVLDLITDASSASSSAVSSGVTDGAQEAGSGSTASVGGIVGLTSPEPTATTTFSTNTGLYTTGPGTATAVEFGTSTPSQVTEVGGSKTTTPESGRTLVSEITMSGSEVSEATTIKEFGTSAMGTGSENSFKSTAVTVTTPTTTTLVNADSASVGSPTDLPNVVTNASIPENPTTKTNGQDSATYASTVFTTYNATTKRLIGTTTAPDLSAGKILGLEPLHFGLIAGAVGLAIIVLVVALIVCMRRKKTHKVKKQSRGFNAWISRPGTTGVALTDLTFNPAIDVEKGDVDKDVSALDGLADTPMVNIFAASNGAFLEDAGKGGTLSNRRPTIDARKRTESTNTPEKRAKNLTPATVPVLSISSSIKESSADTASLKSEPRSPTSFGSAPAEDDRRQQSFLHQSPKIDSTHTASETSSSVPSDVPPAPPPPANPMAPTPPPAPPAPPAPSLPPPESTPLASEIAQSVPPAPPAPPPPPPPTTS